MSIKRFVGRTVLLPSLVKELDREYNEFTVYAETPDGEELYTVEKHTPFVEVPPHVVLVVNIDEHGGKVEVTVQDLDEES